MPGRKKGPATETLIVKMTPALKQQLAKTAQAEDRTMSAVTRRALVAYIYRKAEIQQQRQGDDEPT